MDFFARFFSWLKSVSSAPLFRVEDATFELFFYDFLLIGATFLLLLTLLVGRKRTLSFLAFGLSSLAAIVFLESGNTIESIIAVGFLSSPFLAAAALYTALTKRTWWFSFWVFAHIVCATLTVFSVT